MRRGGEVKAIIIDLARNEVRVEPVVKVANNLFCGLLTNTLIVVPPESKFYSEWPRGTPTIIAVGKEVGGATAVDPKVFGAVTALKLRFGSSEPRSLTDVAKMIEELYKTRAGSIGKIYVSPQLELAFSVTFDEFVRDLTNFFITISTSGMERIVSAIERHEKVIEILKLQYKMALLKSVQRTRWIFLIIMAIVIIGVLYVILKLFGASSVGIP